MLHISTLGAFSFLTVYVLQDEQVAALYGEFNRNCTVAQLTLFQDLLSKQWLENNVRKAHALWLCADSSLQASDVRGKLKVRPPSARARTTPPCAEPVRMGARRARSFWPSPSSAKLSISCANSKPTAT